MPREFYRGDAYALKLSAINLVSNQSFGIPPHRTSDQSIANLLASKGQYFHKNERNGFYYSRWGAFSTTLFALPELFVTHDTSRQLQVGPQSILAHNVFNILVSMATAGLLFAIAGLYTSQNLLRVLYTLACIYASFVFHYLRAQSYDSLQLLFFLSFYLGFVEFLRGASRGVRSWSWLLPLWCLVLVKDFYVVVSAGMAWALWTKWGAQRWRSVGATLGLGFVPPVLLAFLFNYLQFGTVFRETKLVEAVDSPRPFAFDYILPRLSDYLWSGQSSLILYFPLLLVALLGARRLWVRFRPEAQLLLGVFGASLVVLLGFFSTGEWCYGPRFFLFLLPCLSLPAVVEFSDLERAKLRIRCAGTLALLLAFTFLHWQQHERPFFFRYQIEGFFEQMNNPRIVEYFDLTPQFLVAREFTLFALGKDEFYPLTVAMDGLTPDAQRNGLRALRGYCFLACECNYYYSQFCSVP